MRIFFSILLGFCLLGCAASAPNTDLQYLRELKDRAYAGDPQSQYLLGVHYTQNSRWAWDHARGYLWFRDAADADLPDAQYMVAMAKQLGRGTEKDPQEAIVWLERAALQGHARSQYQLGLAFLNGTGTEKDQTWGRQWLEQAAHHEHKEAQLLLAALFHKGIGGVPNQAEAWRWLQRAQSNGHPKAKEAIENLAPLITKAEKTRATTLNRAADLPNEQDLFSRPLWRYLQATLNSLGYQAGKEDGLYGPSTEAAMTKYLIERKLPRDIRLNLLIEHLRGT